MKNSSSSSCYYDIATRLKRQAIDNGKLFTIQCIPTISLPGEQCGFKRVIEKKQPINCLIETDERAVVSLALTQKQSSILGTYANKLPIMTMNVSRYLFTVEAFVFRNANTDSATDALDFYIKTDISQRNNDCPANQEFSKLLHRFRTCGYLEYIFELARHLNLNIDVVFNRSIVVRYFRIEQTKIVGIGFITVIRDGTKWYVKTTKTPIVTETAMNY